MGGHGPRMILPHLVIGGGPAGAMTAAGLARRGEAVVLLEKTAGPHSKICGEFLSWEARDMLRRKGVTLPGGAPIDRLRIVASRLMREVPLPAEALGISRFELDEALLNHAARCGAEIRRGVHVGAFLPPRAVRLRDGSRLQAERIYLATGKTELRGAARDTGRQRVTRDLTGYRCTCGCLPTTQPPCHGPSSCTASTAAMRVCSPSQKIATIFACWPGIVRRAAGRTFCGSLNSGRPPYTAGSTGRSFCTTGRSPSAAFPTATGDSLPTARSQLAISTL